MLLCGYWGAPYNWNPSRMNQNLKAFPAFLSSGLLAVYNLDNRNRFTVWAPYESNTIGSFRQGHPQPIFSPMNHSCQASVSLKNWTLWTCCGHYSPCSLYGNLDLTDFYIFRSLDSLLVAYMEAQKMLHLMRQIFKIIKDLRNYIYQHALPRFLSIFCFKKVFSFKC